MRRRKPSIRSSLLPSALRIPFSVIDPFTAFSVGERVIREGQIHDQMLEIGAGPQGIKIGFGPQDHQIAESARDRSAEPAHGFVGLGLPLGGRQPRAGQPGNSREPRVETGQVEAIDWTARGQTLKKRDAFAVGQRGLSHPARGLVQRSDLAQ